MLLEFRNTEVIITDTSCFILLDKIDALFVLEGLYKNIVTTPEIAKEYGQPLPEWIVIKPVTNKNLHLKYCEIVDVGEASAITLATELINPLLVLDDLKGRKLAAQLNINFTGTLGVLISARQKGVIPSLKLFFDRIKNTDFRIPHVLLDRILQQSGE